MKVSSNTQQVAGTSKNTEEKALGPDEVKIDWERCILTAVVLLKMIL